MNKRQKKKRAKQNEIKKAIDLIVMEKGEKKVEKKADEKPKKAAKAGGVVIDCAAFATKAQIHEAFHNEPSFPNYTGNNLDAMFDMLTEIAEPLTITVKNLSSWEAAPESFRGNVRKLLERAGRENPNLTVSID
ncbi:MAG: barstar family protein [Lachnospiraceae bacterium]|nr:barstar family protein [Lachnospiraceae bacterium]